MEISVMHKDLIMLLKSLKLNTETIVLIMQACEEKGNALQMINYLIDLKEEGKIPTEEMLLKKISQMAEE